MTKKSRSQVHGTSCLVALALLGHFAFSSGIEARTRLLESPLWICHHATLAVIAGRKTALGVGRRRLGFDRVICFTPNDLVEPGAFEPDGVGSVADVSFSVFIRENVIRETVGTVGGVALLDSRMKSGSRVR
jgi:hypothetical protein